MPVDPKSNAELAQKLRRLADRIERMQQPVSSAAIVVGGEAQFIQAGFDSRGMSYTKPDDFAMVNYALFIGTPQFVADARQRHESGPILPW